MPDHLEPPSDEFDRRRRRVLWKLPSGLYLLGTRAGVRRNLMTLNWAGQLAVEPKLVGVSVEHDAVSHDLLSAGGVFALSILRREDRAVVRRFVKPAEDDPDAGTLSGQPVREAVTGAPILASAAAWLDCEVRRPVPLGSHTLWVGEVVDAGFNGDEDVEVLRMEDTRMNYGG
ncbi:MAG TPA: flavin reductase family protein [Acidimicrobiales bacterium]|nr:flavin reductase family protein [Acidimicrobiales bacterium]